MRLYSRDDGFQHDVSYAVTEQVVINLEVVEIQHRNSAVYDAIGDVFLVIATIIRFGENVLIGFVEIFGKRQSVLFFFVAVVYGGILVESSDHFENAGFTVHFAVVGDNLICTAFEFFDFRELFFLGKSAVTDAMFTHEMDKYRGREMDYVFAREKLKGSIPVERFDTYAFSTYGNYDVNGKRSFVSPLEHFDKLEEYIKAGNDIMTAHMMEQTENKLGIESVGRQSYREQQKAKLQTMTENTPQLI